LVENCYFLLPPLCLAPPLGVKPSDLRNDLWCRKTRMLGLSDGERISMICSAVLTQYTRVTDRQTDGIGVAYTRYSIYAVARKNQSHQMQIYEVLYNAIVACVDLMWKITCTFIIAPNTCTSSSNWLLLIIWPRYLKWFTKLSCSLFMVTLENWYAAVLEWHFGLKIIQFSCCCDTYQCHQL